MFETTITIAIASGIILIAFFLVLTYYHSSRAKEKLPTGIITGFIRAALAKDTEGIKITAAKIRSDDKLAYTAMKDNNHNFLITFTDKDGGFILRNVPTGACWLVLEKKGYKTMLRMVKVKQDKVTEVKDVTLQ